MLLNVGGNACSEGASDVGAFGARGKYSTELGRRGNGVDGALC